MTNAAPSPQLLEYPLATEVMVFSTTRQSGFSKGPYASFNINAYCGDAPADRNLNLQLLAQTLRLPVENIVQLHQVHRDRVLHVDDAFLALSQEERKAQADGFDIVMTQKEGVCVGVSTADCIPVILYDPDHKALAVAHAGWRGTVLRVAEKAVAAMSGAYGSTPSRIKAVVGPGISLQAFEVGDEVYEAFLEAGFAMDEIASRMPAANGREKWHIDLWAANYLSLEHAGVDDIRVAGICTYTYSDRFFSARRLGINSGRIYTAAFVKP